MPGGIGVYFSISEIGIHWDFWIVAQSDTLLSICKFRDMKRRKRRKKKKKIKEYTKVKILKEIDIMRFTTKRPSLFSFSLLHFTEFNVLSS